MMVGLIMGMRGGRRSVGWGRFFGGARGVHVVHALATQVLSMLLCVVLAFCTAELGP
jgi:hypothetical protein